MSAALVLLAPGLGLVAASTVEAQVPRWAKPEGFEGNEAICAEPETAMSSFKAPGNANLRQVAVFLQASKGKQ